MIKYLKEPITDSLLEEISNFYNENITVDDICIEESISLEDKEFLNEFILTKKFKLCYIEYRYLINYIKVFRTYNDEKIISSLDHIFNTNSEDLLFNILVLNEYYNRFISFNDKNLYIIKYLLCRDFNFSIIDYFLNYDENEFISVPLENVLESKLSKALNERYNFELFSDLKHTRPLVLCLFYLFDYNYFESFCKVSLNILNGRVTKLSNFLEKAVKRFECEQILLDRYKIGQKKTTLEELGSVYGLTRERIRQLEEKGKLDLLPYKDEILAYVGTIFNIYKNEYDALSIDYLLKYFSHNTVCFISALLHDLYKEYNFNIVKGNPSFIYTGNSIEEKCSTFIDLEGNIITKDNYNKYDDFEKYIISLKYKEEDNYYILRSLNKSRAVCDILESLYPDGFKLHDADVLEKIKSALKDKYFDDFELSDKVLSSYVFREGYISSDRGFYINKTKTPLLDENFVNEIFDYIKENQTVYYVSIYDNFKNKFNEYGINNRYFAKGIIDSLANDDYDINKDYIKLKDINNTMIDTICEYVNSLDGEFTFKTIENKFKAISQSIFDNVLSKCKNIIEFESNVYINYNLLKIEPEDVLLFKQLAEDSFSTFQNRLSIKTIFSYGKHYYDKLFIKYKMINDSFKLFSVLKYNFNEYYYYRPIISKTKLENNSANHIIYSEFEGNSIINFIACKKYALINNLKRISLIDFFDLFKESFVQFEFDRIINKKTLNMRPYQIDAIGQFLDTYLEINGKINSNTFNAYNRFPVLSVKWNKYLLLGIVRSYFSDKYKIDYIKRMTYLDNNVEYIIGRNI